MKALHFLFILFLTGSVIGCAKQNEFPNVYEGYFKGKIDGKVVYYTTEGNINTNQKFEWNAMSGPVTIEKSGMPDQYLMVEDAKLFLRPPKTTSISVGCGFLSDVIDYELAINKLSQLGLVLAKPLSEGSYWGADGFFVNYTDDAGVAWHTSTGPQDNSTFSYELLPSKNKGFYKYIWKCNFSCNLYNKNGRIIRIDDGEFYAPAFLTR